MNGYFLNIVLLISLFLSACNSRNEIEIVDKIDPSIISEDELDEKLPGEFADSTEIVRFKENKVKTDPFFNQKINNVDVLRQLKQLYLAYKKNKNPFAYQILIDKKGIATKAIIEKSLNKELDNILISSLSELPFNIGQVNGKSKEYYKLIDENIFYYNSPANIVKEIAIVNKGDNSYEEGYNQFQTSFLRDRLRQFKSFAILNENEFFKKYGDGVTTFAYEVYFNKDRSVDKIRGLYSFDEKLETEFKNLFSTYKLFVASDLERKIKYTWKFRVYIKEGKVNKTYNRTINEDLDDEIWSNINENNSEIISTIDSSYFQYEYTNERYLNIATSQFKHKLPLVKYFNDISKIALDTDDLNEKPLKIVLHVNKLGTLDKIFFNDNFPEEFKTLYKNELNNFPFGREYIGDEAANYRLTIRSVEALNFPKNIDRKYSVSWQIADERRRVVNDFPLPSQYNDKDFILLPDESPKPVGGYKKLEDKIKYSRLAKYHKVDGKVVVKAFIDETGTILGIQKLSTRGYGLVKEVINVLKETKFEPAILQGKPVKAQLTIPIEFKLDDERISIRRDKIDKALAEYKAEQEKEKSQKLDKLPEPIGGIDAIMNRVKYPKNAQIYGVEGSVIMDVNIDKRGNVTDINFVSRLGYDCDEAAEKAIRETKFKPAISNGKPVATKITIPVRFKLNEENKEGSYKVVFEKRMNLNGKANVSGIVSDIDSNEPIVGGNIVIEGTNLGAATNTDGKYIINEIPAGKYAFKLAGSSHKQYNSEKLILDKDTYYQIDFKLKKDKTNNLFKIVVFGKDKLQFNFKFYTLPKLLKALKSSNLDKDEKIDLASDKTFSVDKDYLVKVRDRIRTIGYKNTFIK